MPVGRRCQPAANSSAAGPKVPCAGTFAHGARLPRHGGLTVTRGLEADAEQRDQTRAPRNRDPREAETGPLVDSCPGPARTATAAGVAAAPGVNEAGHHVRHRPRRHAGLPDLGGQRPQPQPSRLPRRTYTYASSDDCRPGTVCDQRAPRAQPGALRVQRLGARPADGRCPPQSWRTTMRSSRRPPRTLPAASQMSAAPNPRALTGWFGA
jgi:hypothetical protein